MTEAIFSKMCKVFCWSFKKLYLIKNPVKQINFFCLELYKRKHTEVLWRRSINILLCSAARMENVKLIAEGDTLARVYSINFAVEKKTLALICSRAIVGRGWTLLYNCWGNVKKHVPTGKSEFAGSSLAVFCQTYWLNWMKRNLLMHLSLLRVGNEGLPRKRTT